MYCWLYWGYIPGPREEDSLVYLKRYIYQRLYKYILGHHDSVVHWCHLIEYGDVEVFGG